MTYVLRTTHGNDCKLSPTKVVCVGRNYAEHARELNNEVPTEPLLFIKPTTALVDFESTIVLAEHQHALHYETELAILIGSPLKNADTERVERAIAGVALALDLTYRDLQTELKTAGHPWEKAKAFDGSCPITPFGSPTLVNLEQVQFCLTVTGKLQQSGDSSKMITPILPLIAYVSRHFSLCAGDIVLTGTPAGVGQLTAGDKLHVEMPKLVSATTSVY
ncbi:fumarylacetoacetate hydrolase family protein [Paraferrimonas haliotis]|uniref:Isomerase/hydrolase n=1 Tax=Paraferrimonas haliotis TaxID=2013866 RepID=A0AA37TR03_9GAMM|nr:fumarylacetoacetate hydrolase family protein [Paraferrimonas haliotis]GLS82677.1 isomerase/hydrolase [Paraferrimonas haliotis]